MEILRESARNLGLVLSPPQEAELLAFAALLHKWNRKYSLTAARSVDEIVVRHVVDSITVLPYLQGSRCLDFGTGAGLPGIPLAILDRARQFVLLDSNRKKTRFVVQATLDLHLAHVTVVTERVERYQAEPFDTIVSRAVASVSGVVAHVGHLWSTEGRLILMKGENPEAELGDLPSGCFIDRIVPVTLPMLASPRTLVIVGRGENRLGPS